MIRIHCPVRGYGCSRAWDCGTCRELVRCLREEGIPDEEVQWLCASCGAYVWSRPGLKRSHRPGGYYTSGECFRCGKYSSVLQLIVPARFYRKWKEILSVPPPPPEE